MEDMKVSSFFYDDMGGLITTGKLRVCAYCRVSTDQEEQKTSYQLQTEYYRDWIVSHENWTLAGIYADEGITGTNTKKRHRFNQMIEDAKKQKFDMIVTKSISRFARNTLDCIRCVRDLKNLSRPVGVYFEKENIYTLDAKSELILTILSSLAQDESRTISENISWAFQKKFQRGDAHIPTNGFLGYDKDGAGNLIVNEEEAKTVRMIYEYYLDGLGVNKIAQKLMEEKRLTGRGREKWNGNAVLRILKNEKYCGDVIMQKRITVDFLTHKRVENKGQKPMYFIENHHQAIIDREVWNLVQDKIKNRSQKSNGKTKEIKSRYSSNSVFSNRLMCGNCAERYIRRTYIIRNKKERKKYFIWRCKTVDKRVEEKQCKASNMLEIAIKQSFMEMLYEIKEEKQSFGNEFKTLLFRREQELKQNERIDILRMQIEDLQKLLAENYRQGIHDVIQQNKINFREQELLKQLETCKKEYGRFMGRQREYETIHKDFLWFLEQLNDFSDQKEERMYPFREDIYKRVIKEGRILDDDRISYFFSFGIRRVCTGNGRKLKELRKYKCFDEREVFLESR